MSSNATKILMGAKTCQNIKRNRGLKEDLPGNKHV